MWSSEQEYAMEQNKVEFLRSQDLLNPRPERVSYPLFDTTEFFDPRICRRYATSCCV